MEIKAFNKWSIAGIAVADLGLQKYLSLEPRFVPKTGAKYAGKKFHKSKTFIVERLINKVMVPGHIKKHKHFRSSGFCTGKAATAYGNVKKALEIIEKKTKENPIGVFVKAIEHAAPREEIVTIEYGGARYPKAVECAPQRRIDVSLRNFVWGAYGKSWNSKKSFSSALADEILAAFNLDQRSFALGKKRDLERQADSSR
jgi:small subunit ribosomal protein S7